MAALCGADPLIVAGDVVWVRDETHGRPLAVGLALAAGPELVAATQGKGGDAAVADLILELLARPPEDSGGARFADADLESAANAQVAGIFAATGQSCVAGSRLIVESTVKDRFLEILKAKAHGLGSISAARFC